MAKASSPVIAQALAQLRASVAALDAVAAKRETTDMSADKLKTELTLVQDDRVRLANDLDAALARLGRYDQINADLKKRIERAMLAVRDALGKETGDA
jgi:hypothetical protein